jgi:bifunctional enzyme CysN/CysC
VDVSRGDLLVRPENLPHQSRELEVMLAWLVETPLRTEARYLVQHGSRTTPAQVRQLRYRTNINSLRREPATTLELNEIGRCQLLTHRPLDFDAYFRNRTTGSLILIDPVSHETVAAGILVDRQVDSRPSEPTGSGAVTLEERCQRSGQRPALLWLDGPADLARAVGERLERELFQEGYLVRCFPGAESEGSVKVLLAEIRTLLSVGFLVLVGQGQPAQASGDLASILGVRVVLHPLKGVESDPGEEVEICRALLLGEAS